MTNKDKNSKCYTDAAGSIRWKNNAGRLHRECGPAVVRVNGRSEWWVNGEPHRIDGPAIEMDGYRGWYDKGQPHRIGGPAHEWDNGDKEWWQDGEPHREDGPAFEYVDGTKEWYIHGRELDPLEIFLLTGQQKVDT